jgi:hypothetical protein
MPRHSFVLFAHTHLVSLFVNLAGPFLVVPFFSSPQHYVGARDMPQASRLKAIPK